MDEVERNSILLELIEKLLNDNDYKSINLIRGLLERDTPAMRKSFEIVTSGRLQELKRIISGRSKV